MKYGQAYGPLVFAMAVVKLYQSALPWLEEGRGWIRPKKGRGK
jgi:hypothetical protein